MTERIIYWDADPVLFWVTDAFALNYYGVLFMTGIFIGYLIVKTIYKREGVPVAQLDWERLSGPGWAIVYFTSPVIFYPILWRCCFLLRKWRALIVLPVIGAWQVMEEQ